MSIGIIHRVCEQDRFFFGTRGSEEDIYTSHLAKRRRSPFRGVHCRKRNFLPEGPSASWHAFSAFLHAGLGNFRRPFSLMIGAERTQPLSFPALFHSVAATVSMSAVWTVAVVNLRFPNGFVMENVVSHGPLRAFTWMSGSRTKKFLVPIPSYCIGEKKVKFIQKRMVLWKSHLHAVICDYGFNSPLFG